MLVLMIGWKRTAEKDAPWLGEPRSLEAGIFDILLHLPEERLQGPAGQMVDPQGIPAWTTLAGMACVA